MSRATPHLFWLLARTDTAGAEAPAARLPTEGRTLPVFSFEDEARMFLDLGTARDGWRVRETPVEELLSMLLDTHADVETVLLDPLPNLDGRAAAELVGVPREAFVVRLLDRLMNPASAGREPARARLSAAAAVRA